ncbi:PCYCGC domain-containing protein [Gottfriedia luciferensis]|uniref:PCYCGC domain-containing protein n=1 Tax=Gottfriedia luciferensis TaxID=178774 RepID=UPI001F30540B|nr:PCYCGC domain-containing protein [Gottfriedia luciferensis]
MKRKMIHNVLSVLAVSIVLAGCNSQQAETTNSKKHQKHQNHSEHKQTSDIREQTNSKDIIPKFLADREQQIQQIYLVAAQHTDLLKNIPCYCGCGESVGHKSNLDCFINEVKKDGSIVWDSHATTCINCMEIAIESAKYLQDGKTPIEIRKLIDDKYKNGYAKPTNTPMPSI